jgi:hypothetical protein
VPVDYRWNASARRYIRPTGRFVPRVPVRNALDMALAKEQQAMRALSGQLRAGSISVDQWHASMRTNVKHVHIYSTALAHGGIAQTTNPAVMARMQSRIARQNQYLDRFARQIDAREIPLDGRFLQRCDLYAHAGRTTYTAEDRIVMQEAGYTMERSVLHIADHCDECMDAAQMGWVPIGTNTPPGERQCLANCHCSMEYEGKGEPAPVAAAPVAAPPDPLAEIEAQYAGARYSGPVEQFPGVNNLSPVMNDYDSDSVLGAIYRTQGYDGLPALVDTVQMDALVAQRGWTELHRGMMGGPTAGRSFAAELQTGQYYPGLGIYGNGTYSAVGSLSRVQPVLSHYTVPGNSEVVRMALNPRAKVVKYGDVESEMRRAGYVFPDGPHVAKVVGANEGRFASMRGYDAILVEDAYGDISYMVVLNRRAVAMQKEVILP